MRLGLGLVLVIHARLVLSDSNISFSGHVVFEGRYDRFLPENTANRNSNEWYKMPTDIYNVWQMPGQELKAGGGGGMLFIPNWKYGTTETPIRHPGNARIKDEVVVLESSTGWSNWMYNTYGPMSQFLDLQATYCTDENSTYGCPYADSLFELAVNAPGLPRGRPGGKDTAEGAVSWHRGTCKT